MARDAAVRTKVRAWVLVNSHHTDSKGRLVAVNLVPLGVGQSTAVSAVVIVGNAADEDDRAIVGVGSAAVERGQVGTGLGDQGLLPGNAVGVQSRANASDVKVIAAQDEDCAADGLLCGGTSKTKKASDSLYCLKDARHCV